MPIRSPRLIYKIPLITVHLDDNPEAIDTAPTQTVGGTKREIYIKMKESIGEYFELTPMPWNDPLWTGVFGAGGLNQGSSYRRNIGGFREASYKLVAHSAFSIRERVPQTNGTTAIISKNFRTMSIGFPKGHSVTEVINWLSTLDNFGLIAAVVTPAGRRVPLGSFQGDSGAPPSPP